MRLDSLLHVALMSIGLAGVALGQSYSVTGVLRSTNGLPITRGHLSATLAKSGSGSDESTSETDDRGRFIVSLKGPGRWKLTGSAPGFQSSALEEHGDFFTGIVVTAAKPSIEVTFQLTPDASIDGYILDEAGEAVRSAAQVTLLTPTEQDSGQEKPSWHTRGSTRPDDRGHFEFTGLAPGRYEVMVQAQPWYAAEISRRSVPSQTGAPGIPQADAPLDVAYPLTWFPGVTDAAAAGVLTLQGGETRQADLRLLPVPAIHIRVAAPAVGDDQRVDANVPQLRLLTPDGVSRFQPGRSTSVTSSGVDLGGLAPGTYEVTGSEGTRQSSILRIGPSSPRTLDLSSAVPTIPVSIHFNVPEGIPAPEVHFTDKETGQITPPQDGRGEGLRGGALSGEFPFSREGERGRGGLRGRAGGVLHQRGDQTIDLPPGRYDVSVRGDQGQYLIGLTASGADASGKTVAIHGGTPSLVLHVGASHGTLSGIATLHEKAAAGAMVLLVPTTMGDAQSMMILRREQTNTDGSFSLTEIIPGRYILVAIDHGWSMDWNNLAVLNRYLVHGVPIDLSTARSLQEAIEVQSP